MSRPRYKWWTYARNMVYSYPALCQQHKQALHQSVTASYSGQPGGGGDNRKTEETVIRAMGKTAMREYEAVRSAIEQTMATGGGAEKLTLIRLIYWRRSHTLEGAAQEVHVSYATARRWHVEFIRRVGSNYGFFE